MDVNNYFNFDKDIIRVPLNLWVDPPFETKIIEEDERTILFWDHWGVKELVKKDAFCSPAYIEWPVKNRADWEKLKERRFQPSIETRVPADYPHLIKGKSEIDVELSRLPGVIKQGGVCSSCGPQRSLWCAVEKFQVLQRGAVKNNRANTCPFLKTRQETSRHSKI